MPRMGKKKRIEMGFYINESGRIEYNKLCRDCLNGCKQAHKSLVVSCRNYKPKRGN